MAIYKQFYYKVYSPNGDYITSWYDAISLPTFSWTINGSLGNQSIQLPRSVNDFGETEDVALFNQVETWVRSSYHPQGKRVHVGVITSYEQSVSEDNIQSVVVHVIPNTFYLQRALLQDGSGNTTLNYLSEDPSNIAKSILDYAGTMITYSGSSIENTGTSVSYEYKYITALDALKKVIELCPAYWHWYIDADNIVHMRLSDMENADHSLMLGREVSGYAAVKTIENMYNAVYFLGGEVGGVNLYKKYAQTTSIADYGELAYPMQDTRVTLDSTAEIMSQRLLNESDHFDQTVNLTVVDPMYDIESIKPGDVIIVNSPNQESSETLWWNDANTAGNAWWDESYWDFDIAKSLGIPMQVMSINYKFYTAELTVSTRLPEITKRIEDIERNLVVTQSSNIPSSP